MLFSSVSIAAHMLYAIRLRVISVLWVLCNRVSLSFERIGFVLRVCVEFWWK